MPLAPKKFKEKTDGESTSLLNLLDSLYEEGLPEVETEEEMIGKMTPGQAAPLKPPMEKTPLPGVLNEKQGILPKKEEEEEEDESVVPPTNVTGIY